MQICPGRCSVGTDEANCYARLAARRDGPRRAFCESGEQIKHAHVHARSSPQTDSGKDRAEVRTQPCEYHVDRAHCCFEPQRRLYGKEHRRRHCGQGKHCSDRDGDVTSATPRSVGPGGGSDVGLPSGREHLQRHLPAWRALEPGEWIMESFGPIFLLFGHRFR